MPPQELKEQYGYDIETDKWDPDNFAKIDTKRQCDDLNSWLNIPKNEQKITELETKTKWRQKGSAMRDW